MTYKIPTTNAPLPDSKDRIVFTQYREILTPYRKYKPKMTLGEWLFVILVTVGLGALIWFAGLNGIMLW